LFSRKRWRRPPEKPPYSTTKQATSASTFDFPSKTSTSTCSPEKPQTLPASVPSRSHLAETRKETEKDDDQDVTRMTVTAAVPLHQAQSSFQKLRPRKHSTNKSKNSQAFLFFDCFEPDKSTANDFSTLVINSTGRKRPVRIPDPVRRDKKAPLSFLDERPVEDQSKTKRNTINSFSNDLDNKNVFFNNIDLNHIDFSVTKGNKTNSTDNFLHKVDSINHIDFSVTKGIKTDSTDNFLHKVDSINHIDFPVTKGIKTISTDNFLHKVDSIYTSDVEATGGTKPSTTNNVYEDNVKKYSNNSLPTTKLFPDNISLKINRPGSQTEASLSDKDYDIKDYKTLYTLYTANSSVNTDVI
jgi:hypothetical protein